MRKVWSIGIVLFLVLCAFQITKEPLFSVPTSWPKPVYDFSKNPLTSQKVEFPTKNILKIGNRSKTYIRRYKSLMERQETRFMWGLRIYVELGLHDV